LSPISPLRQASGTNPQKAQTHPTDTRDTELQLTQAMTKDHVKQQGQQRIKHSMHQHGMPDS
jgi:hypothetical protein